MKKYNYFVRFVPYGLFLLLVSYFHRALITNAYTAGSDGQKIFPELEMYNYYNSYFPLWNHFKLGGGTPFVAEPERFFLLNIFIDPASPYFNLYLNLIYLAILAALCILCFRIFLKFGFGKFAAFVGVFVIVFSDRINELLYYGRINGFFTTFLSFAIVLLYINFRETRNRLYIPLISLLIGIVLDMQYQYSVLGLYIPVLIFTGYYMVAVKKESLIKFISMYLFDMFYLSLLGLAFVAFSVLPMLEYMLLNKNVLAVDELGIRHMADPATFSTIFSMKYLGKTNIEFKRIPFFFIMAVAPYLFLKLKEKTEKKVMLILLIFFVVFFLLIIGRVAPGAYVIELWKKTPLLNLIRDASVFYFPVVYVVAIISMMIADLIYTYNRHIRNLLFVASVLYMVFYIFIGSYDYRLRTYNAHGKIGIGSTNIWEEYLFKDKTLFNIYNRDRIGLIADHPLRKLLWFSTYNPTEYRAALGVLYNKNDLNKMKANWNFVNNISNLDLNYRAFELLNVKYLYLNEWEIPAYIQKNWKLVNIEDDRKNIRSRGYKIRLYSNPEWRSQVRLYYSYESVNKTDIKDVINKYLSDENFRKVALTDKTTNLIPSGKGNKRIKNYELIKDGYSVRIDAEHSAVLQIPSYYDINWNVYINGAKGTLLRVNGIYMGTYVDKGEHTVVFKYEPRSYYIGLYLSSAALIMTLLLTFLYLRGKRKEILYNGG